MKPFIMVGLAGMFLAVAGIFSFSAGASPVLGLYLPKKHQVFWGLQDHYIRGRALDDDRGALSSWQNYLTAAWGITDWLTLDAKWSLHSTFRQTDRADGTTLEYDQPVWGGGYGLRIRVYENGALSVGTGLHHFSIHPRTVKGNGVKYTGIMEDWQGSVVVAYDLKRFRPYIAGRYTSTDYIYWRDNIRSVDKSPESRRGGVVTGVDVPLGKKVWLNLEVDWQERGAFTTAVMWTF